jgi:hypothetical protein
MSWATSSGSPLVREAESKARTRVSTGPPAHTKVLLVPGPYWGSDLPGAPDLYIYIGARCPSVGVRTYRGVAPFGPPIRWGQARSSAWLGDVAWVRCPHAIGEGTPDLGYRQKCFFDNLGLISSKCFQQNPAIKKGSQ